MYRLKKGIMRYVAVPGKPELKVYRMIRGNTEDSDVSDSLTIKRGEVHKFASMNAEILIAPAMAIERGHNIVDDTGHFWEY